MKAITIIMHNMTAPRGTLKDAKEAVMSLDTHQNHRLSVLRDQMNTARTKSQFLDLAEMFSNYLDFLTTKAKDYSAVQARRMVSELNCYVWLPLNCGTADKAKTIAAARAVCPMIADDLNDYSFESLQTRTAQWIDVMHFVMDHDTTPEGEPEELNAKREAIRSGAWVAEAQDAEFNTRKMRLMIESGAYDAEHAEALRMNEGITLAVNILTAVEGSVEGARGCLIREGYDEVYYLVQVASRKVQPDSRTRQQAKFFEMSEKTQGIFIDRAHAEALEENARFDWLANRFGLFQVTDADTQVFMVEQAHIEAMFAHVEDQTDLLKRAAHIAANSFGHVLGEHEDLIEKLIEGGHYLKAAQLEEEFENLNNGYGFGEHREIRKAYIAMLHNHF